MWERQLMPLFLAKPIILDILWGITAYTLTVYVNSENNFHPQADGCFSFLGPHYQGTSPGICLNCVQHRVCQIRISDTCFLCKPWKQRIFFSVLGKLQTIPTRPKARDRRTHRMEYWDQPGLLDIDCATIHHLGIGLLLNPWHGSLVFVGFEGGNNLQSSANNDRVEDAIIYIGAHGKMTIGLSGNLDRFDEECSFWSRV